MKTKETKKLMSGIFSMLLSTMLIAGSVATVLAETVHGDGVTDAQVSLTKNYMVPAGVTLPAASFEFTYTKDGIVKGASAYNSEVIGDETQPELAIPEGEDCLSISYEAGLTKDATVGGKDIYVATKDDILPQGSDFEHAGEYVYTITEVDGTNENLDDALTYSQAEYKMHVFVKNSTNGLVVAGVAVYQTKNDAGAAGTNAKVNLDNNNLVADHGNEFAFGNLYAPTDEVLSISKTVQGDYADLTKPFSMNVTLNKPTTYDETSFSAVIVDSTSMKPVDATLISFTDTESEEITLKTEQKLVFVDAGTSLSTDTAIDDDDMSCMPAGLSYSVVESGETDYTPKATVTHGGVSDGQITGTAGETFTVNTNTIVDIGSNIAALESEYHSITITGLLVRIVPAVLMIIVAIAGFAIVFSRKKAA